MIQNNYPSFIPSILFCKYPPHSHYELPRCNTLLFRLCTGLFGRVAFKPSAASLRGTSTLQQGEEGRHTIWYLFKSTQLSSPWHLPGSALPLICVKFHPATLSPEPTFIRGAASHRRSWKIMRAVSASGECEYLSLPGWSVSLLRFLLPTCWCYDLKTLDGYKSPQREMWVQMQTEAAWALSGQWDDLHHDVSLVHICNQLEKSTHRHMRLFFIYMSVFMAVCC